MWWPGRSAWPCLRSILLLFLLGGGGGEVADAYPLVVVESDTARVSGLQLVKSDTARVSGLQLVKSDTARVSGLQLVKSDTARVSGLQLVKSDTARVSVLPVAGCKFSAVFLGKVALDVVGLRVDSEETLLTLTDERAQLARAAPGVTLVDSSDKGAPVRKLIRPSVLGEPLVVNLQEPTPVEKRLEYAIQATASVWEPLEQVHCVVSGDVDFDSFGMAPWDACGMRGGGCRFCEMFWIMMSCRPVIINGLDRTMRMNTDYGNERIMMTNADSPRLAVTPGEWYASEMLTMMTTELRQMNVPTW